MADSRKSVGDSLGSAD